MTHDNPCAVLHGVRDLRVEYRPRPAPGPHDVLVEIAAVGICGSDVHYYEEGRIGPYVVESPMIIGHEASGTVVATGTEVDPGRVGELVALEPGVPCRHCEQCMAGRYNLCPDVRFFATPPVDGVIARYATIDADFAHPSPTELSAVQAAMAEPTSVGVWAARKTRISVTDRVLVTGAGPVGLLAAQVARAHGADRVVVSDLNEHRLAIARDLGLEAVSADDLSTGTFEADVLLECSGAQPALTSGITATAPAARIALIGMGADDVSIPVPLVQGRELTISGVFRYAHCYPVALRMIASGAVRTDPLITHHFALDETEDALTVGRRDPEAIKPVVEPGRRQESENHR
ncbi:NAD(P)-dependent alcohol dehydrogenase [Corynebacterium glyciniphilum]|uniref:NAD(P)-dependent alcohol dehydrogenase n=1 Tax=Corynebacterium glyciniphilum TaxID=1404244 RepID=UPI002355B6FD